MTTTSGEVAGFVPPRPVATVAREQGMWLSSFPKRTDAFSEDDVPLGPRVADYIALAVSHEQLAEAERRVAEARVREEHLEARVQSLAQELDVKSGLGRAIGDSAEWKDVLKKAEPSRHFFSVSVQFITTAIGAEATDAGTSSIIRNRPSAETS
jgi:hypothetical protein